MPDGQLYGFISSEITGELPTVDLRNPPPPPQTNFPPVEILDARKLQAGAVSEAQFFAENGFVLLPHVTKVTAWDSDVSTTYAPEIEEIIRMRLLPGRRVEIQQRGSPLRRGRGTPTPYGQGVHSDGPLTAERYGANVRAFASPEAEQWWLNRYRNDDVEGFMSIDFWRITNMQGPLRHMPLALCAPNSLDRADILEMQFKGIAPEGRTTHHLALRFNAAQRWYYYPRMTRDELLAFKLCEFRKGDPDTPPQNCFHSAFRDPDDPTDAEERQSCEHRVGVLILRD